MTEDKKRRLQTATERDLESIAAKITRDTPREGVPAYTCQDITGQYEGEELVEHRARRPTPERLQILEGKHDEVAKRLGGIEVTVAGIAGEMKVIPSLVETMRDATSALRQRESAQVEVDKITRLTEIEISKTTQLATIENDKEDHSTNRKIKVRVISGIVAAATSGAFLHWLLERLS